MPLDAAPSIAAIARAAGTSRATASKVLGGHPEGDRISAPVRERIHACAKALGWQPRPAHGPRRPTLGYAFAYPLPYGAGVYGNFPTILAEATSRSGYDLRVILVDEDLGGWNAMDRRGDPTGLICIESLVPYLPMLLPRLQVPAVLVNWPCDLPMDQVITDDAGGMAQAAQHLHQIGHRHLLYHQFDQVGHPSSKAQRRDGLRASCDALGLHLDEVEGDITAVLAHLRTHPRITAIVTYGGGEALALHAPLQAAGYAIPERISLLCGTTQNSLHLVRPQISYVHTGNWEMAVAAVDLVMKRLRSEVPPAAQTIVIPQCLRLNESVAAPR
jgi:DNA-binding LacI/PurR family transcriptional regulator